MRQFITAVLLFSLISSTSQAATEGENQASSFAKIYAALCLKHLNNLEALREKLAPMPKLPSEKAAHFLADKPGDVWPVPDKYGTFVVALPAQGQFCAVYGQKADTEVVREQFINLVAQAPTPLSVKQTRNDQTQTANNGLKQTVSYEWSVPNAQRAMLFTLTTASSETAPLQVLASAVIISR